SRRFSFASAVRSIELELGFVTGLEGWVLLRLVEQHVLDGEVFDFSTHEAVKTILRRAHDGLAAHIEARVHHDRAIRKRLEARKQRVITRIRLSMHRLNARR